MVLASVLALLWLLLAPPLAAYGPEVADFTKPVSSASSHGEEDSEAEKPYVAEEVATKLVAKKRARERETGRAAMVPRDPTLYLTIPRLGLYGHTVRNIGSQAALDLGAIKLPSTAFPWQGGDANTFIVCHRLGFPSTESFNQCLNLPSMQRGDGIFLQDANGGVYKYRVTEILVAAPQDRRVTEPVKGRDMLSLMTCIENPGDLYTLGPNWQGRLIVRADRVRQR